MISITDKTNTYRRAVATACLVADARTIQVLVNNEGPKKDILVVARVAGTNAAKKTGDLIPYCHPLTLDSVLIDFDVQPDRIWITASVETIWRTGVEMEALAASTVAALTIYDMLKPVNKDMEITSVKLTEKHGGKSSHKEWVPKDFKAAVIVTSDGTSEGKREDKSGKLIVNRLKQYDIHPSYDILPDDLSQIKSLLEKLSDAGADLIVTTGGTGLGPRDVTVEATQQVVDREIPGVMEAARSFGQNRTPYAMLSRGLAGQRGKTIIINFPGSSNGVKESLNAIFPFILHAYPMIRGGGHA